MLSMEMQEVTSVRASGAGGHTNVMVQPPALHGQHISGEPESHGVSASKNNNNNPSAEWIQKEIDDDSQAAQFEKQDAQQRDPTPPQSRAHSRSNDGSQIQSASQSRRVSEMQSAAQHMASEGDQQPIDLRRQLREQNVFVFHLPSEWGEEQLEKEFARFGTIRSVKVVKRPDLTSKGYGFVCFESKESAAAAVAEMNGYQVGVKRLKVSFKKTPEECMNMQVEKLMKMAGPEGQTQKGPPGSMNGGQMFPGSSPHEFSLFVFHLPSHWSDSQLLQEFQPFGNVIDAKVSRKNDGSSRGYGFVSCADPKTAATAIAAMNGREVGNKRLKVQPKQTTALSQRPGCTVFVFHLPNNWSDVELKDAFGHCGNVLSATVQRDLNRNSRGFGFVSFEHRIGARHAVETMNGYQFGIKRLKVSYKKTEDFNNFSSQKGMRGGRGKPRGRGYGDGNGYMPQSRGLSSGNGGPMDHFSNHMGSSQEFNNFMPRWGATLGMHQETLVGNSEPFKDFSADAWRPNSNYQNSGYAPEGHYHQVEGLRYGNRELAHQVLHMGAHSNYDQDRSFDARVSNRLYRDSVDHGDPTAFLNNQRPLGLPAADMRSPAQHPAVRAGLYPAANRGFTRQGPSFAVNVYSPGSTAGWIAQSTQASMMPQHHGRNDSSNRVPNVGFD